MDAEEPYHIGEYRDEFHAEDLSGLRVGDHGYKFRILDGLVMPPYITPSRYTVSRTLRTRAGDICYTSFPKSRPTWLADLILLIVHGGDRPPRDTLRSCLHWVESSWTHPRTREELHALPLPRVFKSHMPYQMAFGDNPEVQPCKYVYIARNPKYVAVSYYFFERTKSWSGYYSGPWKHWLQMFLEGRVQRGDWLDDVLGWWKHRRAGNLHFMRYEDLCRQFEAELRKLAEFLGYDVDDSMIRKIQHDSTFETMQTKPFSNMREIKEFRGFFRKGSVGSWKKQFSAAQSELFHKVYARRMEGSGQSFDFE